jgi:hypothetical protein
MLNIACHLFAILVHREVSLVESLSGRGNGPRMQHYIRLLLAFVVQGSQRPRPQAGLAKGRQERRKSRVRLRRQKSSEASDVRSVWLPGLL